MVGAGGCDVRAVRSPGTIEVGCLKAGDLRAVELVVLGREVLHACVEGADGTVEFIEEDGEVVVEVLVIVKAAEVDEENLAVVAHALASGDESRDGQFLPSPLLAP